MIIIYYELDVSIKMLFPYVRELQRCIPNVFLAIFVGVIVRSGQLIGAIGVLELEYQ